MDISLDTETNGLDTMHGALPYFVTSCDGSNSVSYWEWDVDPLTRHPVVSSVDLKEVQGHLDDAEHTVLQNPIFDVKMCRKVYESVGMELRWDWSKVRDCLLAGHLIASNQPHDLTTMTLIYLGINIKPWEDRLKIACNEARRLARVKFPDWRIAKKGLPEMPSCKGSNPKKDRKGVESESPWKFDAWLPRAICQWARKELRCFAPTDNSPDSDCWKVYHLATKLRDRPWWEEYSQPDHKWWTVLRDYANTDSSVTLPLYKVQEELIKKRGLWNIYLERLKLLPIAHGLETRGVSVSRKRLVGLREKYKEDSEKAATTCVQIASQYDYDLKLPKSGNNDSLRQFVFGPLDLPEVKTGKKRKTDAPSLDKEAVAKWETMFNPNSNQARFVQALGAKRQRDTATNYLNGYERYWLRDERVELNGEPEPEWFLLYPSCNPTATQTLRWGFYNPNSANVSDKEDFNLRYCFGPAPGREWWSLDGKNLELRLPAFECGEKELIDLFERPDDPPYYGSEHLLNFSTVYHDVWEQVLADVGFEKVGPTCKSRFPAIYKRVKNGDFAIGYGSVDLGPGKGTADRTFGRPGAHAMLKSRFAKKEELNQYWIGFAKEHGYVETIPDRTVDPHHGYPLYCTRSKWGKIKETVPLNFHIQGSAMQWTNKASVRCQEYLNTLPDHHMIMQVHDELVFDFPAGVGPEPWRTNLDTIREIKRLMERGGEDIGIPTPVSIDYHDTSWNIGISINA